MGEDNIDTTDYNEMVKNSVLSVTSMPFVDFNKASIGTIDEIIDIIDEFYKVDKFNAIPSKITEYIQKYLSIYIPNKNQRPDFIIQLKTKYYYINNDDETNNRLILNQLIYPHFTKTTMAIVGVSGINLYKSFIDNTSSGPQMDITNRPQIFFYVQTLFFIRMLSEMTKELEKNDVNKKIIKRICDSYDSLYKYFRNAYSNYFGLSGGNSPYHVDDIGISTPQYDMDNTIITKNITESKTIINTNNNTNNFTGINKEILRKILYTNVEKDLFTKK